MDTALEFKRVGNEQFVAGKYDEAIVEYNKGLEALPKNGLTQDQLQEKAKMAANRGECLVRTGKAQEAVDSCTVALEAWPQYVKAFFRRAKAYEAAGNVTKAITDLQSLLKIEPANVSAQQTLRRLKKQAQKEFDRAKKRVEAAFSRDDESSKDEGVKQVQVLWADQQRINKFGRLNTRFQDVADEIDASSQKVENLVDAQDAIESCMEDDEEDAFAIKLGEVFVRTDEDNATEFVESRLAEARKELETQKSERDQLQKEMSQLKAKLYAKFGKSINLEMNPEK